MSGIAYAASTIPGSVATFWSCSSEWSVRIAASSSSSANTRAGTRMSGRASAGISNSVSSILRGSDIEHHGCTPPSRALLERQAVPRRGLDDRLQLGPSPAQHDALAVDVRLVGDEADGVGEVDQLLEQRDQPRG